MGISPQAIAKDGEIHVLLDLLQANYGWPKIAQFPGQDLHSIYAQEEGQSKGIQGKQGKGGHVRKAAKGKISNPGDWNTVQVRC
jgi:hypothetical protein